MKLKNILIATIAGALLLSSCSGFLDEKNNPNMNSTSTFWKSEGDIVKGLTAAYALLQPSMSWGRPYERFIVLDCYRSDELDFRADVAEWTRIATFTNIPTDRTGCRDEWTLLYKGINYANQCIDNIPNVPGVTQEVKDCSIAEARFLRAYYYYRLYLNFGERLPLYDKALKGTEEEFYPKQSAPGVIVEFIERELLAVQGVLPDASVWAAKNQHGRANKYMASAILAKFYMFRKQLPKAEVELKKIIESGKYGLVANYGDLFDGLHKHNKESIFDIQYTANNDGGRREFHRISLHLLSDDAGGYEEAYPSTWLFETMKNDKTVDGKYTDRLYSTIIFNDPNTKPYYFTATKNKFTDWHKPNSIYWHKFVSWNKSLGANWWESAYNIPVVRYADVLLLYAECLNDKGATAEAIGYINTVRARVNAVPLALGLSKADVLKHLQDVERPCELALEGSRWYDLIRWGIVEQALRAHNKPFMGNYVDSKHKMMPIPNGEFLLNPTWEQNPGHSK